MRPRRPRPGRLSAGRPRRRSQRAVSTNDGPSWMRFRPRCCVEATTRGAKARSQPRSRDERARVHGVLGLGEDDAPTRREPRHLVEVGDLVRVGRPPCTGSSPASERRSCTNARPPGRRTCRRTRARRRRADVGAGVERDERRARLLEPLAERARLREAVRRARRARRCSRGSRSGSAARAARGRGARPPRAGARAGAGRHRSRGRRRAVRRPPVRLARHVVRDDRRLEAGHVAGAPGRDAHHRAPQPSAKSVSVADETSETIRAEAPASSSVVPSAATGSRSASREGAALREVRRVAEVERRRSAPRTSRGCPGWRAGAASCASAW